MNKRLKQRIKEFNKIKYPNDKSNRIIIARLKPVGTVTTAPNNKQWQANVTREKLNIP